jgi:hypothetical protein
MTAAISYESESEIVETDDESRLHFTAGEPHRKYVRIVETDGTIRLVPFDLLDDAERAIFEDSELYRHTRQGLADLVAGRGVSSDWLFADDE